MKRSNLGYILIGIAALFLVSIIVFNFQVESLTERLMIESGGSCITEEGCVHEQNDLPIYFGVALVFTLFALGLYLVFFEKSKHATDKIQKEIVDKLHETKVEKDLDEKFSLVMKGLDKDEQKVVLALREQDGIEQATLRLRADLSKTKLSVVLSELEKKNLVKKVAEGKKNRVYLRF